MKKQFKKSAGYLVKQGNKFLLGRPVHDVYWTIFKGGVEKGETKIEAAMRELKEEAGLDILGLYNKGLIEKKNFEKEIHTYTINKKHLKKEVTVFLLDLPKTITIEPKCQSFFESNEEPEIEEFHFFKLSELEGALFKSQLGLVEVLKNC